MERKDYRKMIPQQLTTYFEECIEDALKNPKDTSKLIYKEEVKSFIDKQLGKLVLL